MVDASDQTIRGVLEQQDDQGDFLPLGFLSRALIPTHRRYSTFERELFGVREALRHFRYFTCCNCLYGPQATHRHPQG
uniref:Putative LOC101856697 [Aplysia californica] n=1 Tax=Lepeophtheirus salmonis TaxID=72036 RepID=A0A0K2V3B9_LEPSM